MSWGPLTDIVVFLKVCDSVPVFIRVKVWLHIGDLDIGLKRNTKYFLHSESHVKIFLANYTKIDMILRFIFYVSGLDELQTYWKTYTCI